MGVNLLCINIVDVSGNDVLVFSLRHLPCILRDLNVLSVREYAVIMPSQPQLGYKRRAYGIISTSPQTSIVKPEFWAVTKSAQFTVRRYEGVRAEPDIRDGGKTATKSCRVTPKYRSAIDILRGVVLLANTCPLCAAWVSFACFVTSLHNGDHAGHIESYLILHFLLSTVIV